jgi:hypothetical protein
LETYKAIIDRAHDLAVSAKKWAARRAFRAGIDDAKQRHWALFWVLFRVDYFYKFV